MVVRVVAWCFRHGLRSALEQIESVLGDLQARAKLVSRD
jgi:hypothetical protein